MQTLKLSETIYYKPELPQHLHKQELAKTRGYVRWHKVWEDKATKRNIYRLSYRRFYYMDYFTIPKFLTLKEGPRHLTLELNVENKAFQSYVFSFKNKKLRIFTVEGNLIRSISPLTILSRNPLSRTPKWRKVNYSDCQGTQNNEKRLIKLFLKKCRMNKINFPWGAEKSDTFVEAVMRVYYPAYAQIKEHNNACSFGRGIATYFRYPLKTTIKKICGYNSTKITNLFVQTVSTNMSFKLETIRYVRRLLNNDQIQNLLEDPLIQRMSLEVDSIKITNFYDFIKFFKVSPPLLMKWLKVTNDRNSLTLKDTIRMFLNTKELLLQENNIPHFTNLRELHDFLVRFNHKVKNPDFQLNVDKKIEKSQIECEKIDDFEIVIPHSAHELLAWGETMHNCIGSYAHSVNQGYTIILGLKENDEIKYGIELEPSTYTIRQFRGKYNEAAPKELEEKVKQILLDKKLTMTLSTGEN